MGYPLIPIQNVRVGKLIVSTCRELNDRAMPNHITPAAKIEFESEEEDDDIGEK